MFQVFMSQGFFLVPSYIGFYYRCLCIFFITGSIVHHKCMLCTGAWQRHDVQHQFLIVFRHKCTKCDLYMSKFSCLICHSWDTVYMVVRACLTNWRTNPTRLGVFNSASPIFIILHDISSKFSASLRYVYKLFILWPLLISRLLTWTKKFLESPFKVINFTRLRLYS